MWDYLGTDKSGNITSVYEMKTTKAGGSWKNRVPEYYLFQAALYAYLLKVDDVTMVATFLQTTDYEEPDAFIPTRQNTKLASFKMSQRYPHFEKYVERAEQWWNEHVTTGISPEFDEQKDTKVLSALRTAF